MPGAEQVPKLSIVIRFLEKNSIHLAKLLTTFLKSFTENVKFLPEFSNLSNTFSKSSPKLSNEILFSHFLRKLGRWMPPGWMHGDDPFFLCLVIYLPTLYSLSYIVLRKLGRLNDWMPPRWIPGAVAPSASTSERY